jgi:homoaconitate hydratase
MFDMSQTLVEKIAQKFAVGLHESQVVYSGDYISIRPTHVMTHDNTGAVIPKFKSIGAQKIANPRQLVFALDHNVQDTSEKNLEKYAKIEDFAKEMGVDFYPAGRGIGHQIMCEEGYVWPGTMVVASDSHSNMYGGLGCLGTPIVRTDAAAIWTTGRTWWQVPPVAKVELKGALNPGVTGKDVIITLCGFFNNDEVLNHAIEFTGDGIEGLSVDMRLSIANMTTEWGALVALFPIDEMTIRWLRNRIAFIERRGLANVPSNIDGKGGHPRLNLQRLAELEADLDKLVADPFASYAKELELDLSTVQPHVSGPNTVKTIHAINEIKRQKVKINKAYLISCVNSRLEDLAQAAKVVKGKKVSGEVLFYIAAASSEVQKESERLGYWQTLLEAGAVPLPPGCGPCIGLGTGLLEDGEVGISATNRNFKGRMGSRSSFTYLASPAVVVASAISGIIDFPGEWPETPIKAKIEVKEKKKPKSSQLKMFPDFPAVWQGELIFCFQDNLNTDGIYPGKYTYIDDFTPEQQATVVMENYDPEFKKIVQKGDLLVGGFNFGTGSSREQAATALKYRGIKLVVAGSFNQTYKRNAINNGFLTIEAPELICDLKKAYGNEKLTVRTGINAKIDFVKSLLIANNKKYQISPLGIAAQELIVAGGLENWVRKEIQIFSTL